MSLYPRPMCWRMAGTQFSLSERLANRVVTFVERPSFHVRLVELGVR